MSKFFNNAIVGNSKILGCLTDKGELIRLYYPNIDYFQNIDRYRIGIAKQGGILWLDEGALKKQYYEGNIVYTELNVGEYEVLQRDYVLSNKNVLVRTFKFNKKLNLFLYSKLNSDVNKKVSGMVVNNSLIQYCQDMYMATFSNINITKYQINNSKDSLGSGELYSPDYIGMSDDSAILYADVNEITIYIAFENNLKDIFKTIEWCKNSNENLLYNSVKRYWNNYLKKFANNIIFKDVTKIKEKEILDRSILMFALLTNPETGAVIASPDVDENFERCGRYGYCWPRDALFVNSALNILELTKYTDRFYNVWAKRAQLDSGLFEQRYYSNGELAPSWGLQIDETAAILIGIHENGKYKKLEALILKSITALLNFLDDEFISKDCFDLWEERRGKHLYSTASIYQGLKCGKEILKSINIEKYDNTINEIEKALVNIEDALIKKFVSNGKLKRSIDNEQTDISTLVLATPYDVLTVDDRIIENTVKDIEENLKLPNGGYMRYQWDNYVGGNAWIISSLWLALYYIKKGNFERAQELFDWVTYHADDLAFLPEQIDRNGDKTIWVRQLSWSHALYIIVKYNLVKKEN